LRVFSGTHQWAPAEVMDEGLPWFRMQEMKSQREPRAPAFINEQFPKALARADSLERSGDLLIAWHAYMQIAETYDSLVVVAGVRAKADAMGSRKAVRDAAKRERSQFEEQAKLVDEIASRLNAPPKQSDRDTHGDQDLQDLIRSLPATQNTRSTQKKQLFINVHWARFYRRHGIRELASRGEEIS
jgi:hypothetical protein